jgi:ferric-dicitrate binding protein FerR (iron transport regulator)
MSRILALASGALLALAGPAAAVVTVTSAEGDTASAGEPLAMHRQLGAGDVVETEDEGRCSMLLAEDAVLQLCHGAKLRFGPEGPRGPSVLELTKGELKATVGARPPEDPLEIHTPVAIATILGTVVHVSVDPVTGETVITSLENRIRVVNVDAPDEPVVIATGEQVTVRRGRIPGAVRRADPRELARHSDCLDDGAFRKLAAALERSAHADDLLEEVAAMDVPEALPAVAAGPGLFPTAGLGGPEIAVENVCFPGSPDCNEGFMSGACVGPACNLVGPPGGPGPCGSVPGDQCLP